MHELSPKPKNNAMIVQANKLVEAHYRFSMIQTKIVHFLISEIKKDDDDFCHYRLKVADLEKFLGVIDGSIYAKVKKATEELLKKVMVIPEPDGDLQVSWLSSVKYHDSKGYVDLRFDPALKPYLLNLKHGFTKYYLNIILNLRRAYTARLYTLLKQYEKIGERQIAIADLRAMLLLDSSAYELYGNIKNRIIKTAQKELQDNPHSDIVFDFIDIKKSRKVVAVKFTIMSKKQMQFPFKTAIPKTVAIIEELANYNVTITRIIEKKLKEDPEHIERCLEFYLEEKYQGRNKDNPAGFISDCIKGRIPVPNHIQTKTQREAAKKAIKTTNKELRDNIALMNKLYDDFCQQKKLHANSLLNKGDITPASPKFISWYKKVYGNFFYELKYENGKPKKIESFERYLLEYISQYLSLEQRDFIAYAKSKGYQVKPGDYPNQSIGYIFDQARN